LIEKLGFGTEYVSTNNIAVSAQFLKILARSKNDGQAQGAYSPQPGSSAPAAAADDTFSDLPF
jgi:hypothetical protein